MGKNIAENKATIDTKWYKQSNILPGHKIILQTNKLIDSCSQHYQNLYQRYCYQFLIHRLSLVKMVVACYIPLLLHYLVLI